MPFATNRPPGWFMTDMPISAEVLGLIDATSNDGFVPPGLCEKIGNTIADVFNRSKNRALPNFITILPKSVVTPDDYAGCFSHILFFAEPEKVPKYVV